MMRMYSSLFHGERKFLAKFFVSGEGADGGCGGTGGEIDKGMGNRGMTEEGREE